MRIDGINVIGSCWIHRVADKDTHRHRGPKDAGRLIYSIADDKVYFGTNSDWEYFTGQYDVINQGGKLLMGKYPLPTGWNIVVRDDIVVMLTDRGTNVGDEDGSWVISGVVSAGSHSDHTIARTVYPIYNWSTYTFEAWSDGKENYYYIPGSGEFYETSVWGDLFGSTEVIYSWFGSDYIYKASAPQYANYGHAYYNHDHAITAVDGVHTHTFDGVWRPKYSKFCEAELQ